MKKALALALVVVCVLGLTELGAQQPLPITRVLLYKNGMAYIVRGGQLTTPLTLTFHPEDMNDVLKSFTALNPESGALYSVGYTAGIPSRYMLRRFPFDMGSADIGLSGFLTQVKGADLRLMMASPVEGRLVAVQPADRVVSPQTSTRDHRLTVLIKSGALQTVWLSDVRSVEFSDAQLREQLRSYLDVLAETRQDVTREISIYPVPATGPIQVGYLQQFPLWKTSYRIDLGDRESRIQGWAQIDNPTGEAWNNVEVALLSGSPVSFNMNLYEPLYTVRSTVAVPGGQVAGPRQYEAALRPAMSESVMVSAAAPPVSARGGSGAGTGGGVGPGGTQTYMAGHGMSSAQNAIRGDGMQVSGLEATGSLGAYFQQADALELEDLFEYRFPFPIQLASRQSALLPFLQKTLKIERLSIFNSQDRNSARLGAQLENVTGMPLEPGPVTFFESGRYTGEAVLSRFARGEKRLISFGVDHDVQIAFKQQSQPETTTRLTIAKGVAVFTRESALTTTYEIRNKGAERTLIVEHPRIADRKLAGTTPWETTEGFYRFRLALKADASIELPVNEVVSRKTDVALGTLTRDELVVFEGSYTPGEVREKLGQLVELQEQRAVLQADLKAAEEDRHRVVNDQDRLRENIKALKETRDDQNLRRRYLSQLTAQEDELQALRTRIDALLKELSAAHKRFDDAIAAIAWEPSAEAR